MYGQNEDQHWLKAHEQFDFKVGKKVLKKKMGYEVDFKLSEVLATMTISDEVMHVHLNVDAEMDKEEFKNVLLVAFGLGT